MVPSKEHKNWHDGAMLQLLSQKIKLIEEVRSVTITMYAPDRIPGDLSNKAESIMDLLVDRGILKDDNWFVVPELISRFGGVDRDNPRAEISIV